MTKILTQKDLHEVKYADISRGGIKKHALGAQDKNTKILEGQCEKDHNFSINTGSFSRILGATGASFPNNR